MAQFRPQPFTAALILLKPTAVTVMGVEKKTFPAPKDGVRFNGSFKTYGGTERDVNGLYSIEDTATVECWYDPQITGACRVYVPDNGGTYEILGEPEDISLRHQFMRFKVRRYKGGA